jgi:uncharacterized lipoprotein YajG
MMWKIILVLISVLVLSGCAKKDSEFIGSWKNRHQQAVIKRNGTTYLVTVIDRQGKNTFPAIYADGLLRIKTSSGSVDIAYLKEKNAILIPPNIELKRIQQKK